MDKFDLDNDHILYEIEECAQCDYETISSEMFFFGVLHTEDPELPKTIEDGKTYAHCPTCGELFLIPDDSKTGEPIDCPHCKNGGSLYDYHDEDLLLDNIDYSRIAYFEEACGSFVLRIFEYCLDFSCRDYDNFFKLEIPYPDLYVNETYREYWENGKIEYYRQNDVYEWERIDQPDEENCYLIAYDLDEENSQYVEDVTNGKCTFMEILNTYTPLKAYRTFKKYGFETLAKECLSISECRFPDDDRISVLLGGVDYNQLVKDYDRVAVTSDLLNDCRHVKELGLKVSPANVEIYSRLQTENYSPDNVKRTFKYLRHVSGGSYDITTYDYNDYINSARDCGEDVNAPEIRYPSDFKKAHDKMTKKATVIRNEKQINDFMNTAKKYQRLDGFSNENYVILLAKYPEDLIQEGKALHHCVGTYVNRVAEQKCLIFFIRKKDKEEEPFYTLELDTNDFKIVQCRGKQNYSYTNDEDILHTVNAWHKWVKKRLKKIAA